MQHGLPGETKVWLEHGSIMQWSFAVSGSHCYYLYLILVPEFPAFTVLSNFWHSATYGTGRLRSPKTGHPLQGMGEEEANLWQQDVVIGGRHGKILEPEGRKWNSAMSVFAYEISQKKPVVQFWSKATRKTVCSELGQTCNKTNT